MMRRATAIVLATGALAAPVVAQDAGSWKSRLGEMVRDTVLANGLTVIVAQQRSVPLVTTNVVVRTGAFTQLPGEEGVAHIYEHLLFRAYGPDLRFARDVAAINGTYNGTTSEDAVNYYVTAPSEGMDRTIDILANLVTSPRFRDGDLEAEKRVVLGELQRNASESRYRFGLDLGRRLWGPEMVRKDALGTEESIRGLKMARVREVFAKYYVPNNAAIVVSGDVDAASVFRKVADAFGNWKAGPNPLAEVPPIVRDTVRAPQVFANSEPHQRLVTVTLQWVGPGAATDPEATLAADVFSELVNSPLSPVVERLTATGLVQSVSLSYLTRRRAGVIELSAEMVPAAAERGIQALRAELDAFTGAAYLSDSLVATARIDREVASEYWLERGSAVAHTLAFWWAAAGLEYLRNYVDALQHMTPSDIERHLRAYVIGRPYVAGALAPASELVRVRALMETSFGTPQP